ncbi:helix-turn-helix domain-containing protein [Curtanaerobium respiraculi]|uniref:helix-turn-helix domain-containing protein n=1 Tax=Curtanaerobium respiraculi TaxID=2949669 RepID=UPI0024B32E63|nr:AraC family transcriptional regulator [Curtanaerobium respiraculi]
MMEDIEGVLMKVCSQLGMEPSSGNPFDCGTYLAGDGRKTRGHYWFITYAGHIAVSKCDFSFTSDVAAAFPADTRYISLRLDYAQHLPPGKIVAFLEEAGGNVPATMKRGLRVAYTEVMYLPSFYESHLRESFGGYPANPTDVLRSIAGEHNWSTQVMTALDDVRNCTLAGAAAQLFCVGKAYELMAALLQMGNERLPKQSADYERVSAVIAYINENFAKEIEQSELVQVASMSATKLKNLFKQFTGLTVTQYVLERKTDRAMHLLSDTSIPIYQVAREAGFQTASGFATSFRKQSGMTPREYRTSMRSSVMLDPSADEHLTFGS